MAYAYGLQYQYTYLLGQHETRANPVTCRVGDSSRELVSAQPGSPAFRFSFASLLFRERVPEFEFYTTRKLRHMPYAVSVCL